MILPRPSSVLTSHSSSPLLCGSGLESSNRAHKCCSPYIFSLQIPSWLPLILSQNPLYLLSFSSTNPLQPTLSPPIFAHHGRFSRLPWKKKDPSNFPRMFPPFSPQMMTLLLSKFPPVFFLLGLSLSFSFAPFVAELNELRTWYSLSYPLHHFLSNCV